MNQINLSNFNTYKNEITGNYAFNNITGDFYIEVSQNDTCIYLDQFMKNYLQLINHIEEDQEIKSLIKDMRDV